MNFASSKQLFFAILLIFIVHQSFAQDEATEEIAGGENTEESVPEVTTTGPVDAGSTGNPGPVGTTKKPTLKERFKQKISNLKEKWQEQKNKRQALKQMMKMNSGGSK